MEPLERFIKAIEYLKTKADAPTNEGVARLLRYNAENYISDVIGGSKDINKQLLKRMVEFSINPDWVKTGKGKMILESQSSEPPLSQVNEDPADYNKVIPLGDINITVKDIIEDLKIDKKKLQNTIDANLTAMMQILTVLQRHDQAFHETILKSLGRIEGGNIDLVLEARRFEAELQIQDSLQGSNAQAGK